MSDFIHTSCATLLKERQEQHTRMSFEQFTALIRQTQTFMHRLEQITNRPSFALRPVCDLPFFENFDKSLSNILDNRNRSTPIS